MANTNLNSTFRRLCVWLARALLENGRIVEAVRAGTLFHETLGDKLQPIHARFRNGSNSHDVRRVCDEYCDLSSGDEIITPIAPVLRQHVLCALAAAGDGIAAIATDDFPDKMELHFGELLITRRAAIDLIERLTGNETKPTASVEFQLLFVDGGSGAEPGQDLRGQIWTMRLDAFAQTAEGILFADAQRMPFAHICESFRESLMQSFNRAAVHIASDKSVDVRWSIRPGKQLHRDDSDSWHPKFSGRSADLPIELGLRQVLARCREVSQLKLTDQRLRAIDLAQVVATAQLASDGSLEPVVGILPKITAATSHLGPLPVRAILLAAAQTDVGGESAGLTVYKARNLDDAVEQLSSWQTRESVADYLQHFGDEYERLSKFCGRQSLMQELLGQVAARAPWILVCGVAGKGKSGILNALRRHWDGDIDPNSPHATVHHFIGRNKRDWADPVQILRNLLGRLMRQYPKAATASRQALGLAPNAEQRLGVQHNVSTLHFELGKLLRAIAEQVLVPRSEQLVVLVDGLDELADSSPDVLHRLLPSALPSNVTFIVSSRPTHPQLQFFDRLPTFRIDLDGQEWYPSNEESVRLYWELHRGTTDDGRALEPSLPEHIVQAAISKADGNLQYATALCRIVGAALCRVPDYAD